MTKIFAFLIFFCLTFTNIFAQNVEADLIIVNAKIRTLDKTQPTAEAVAVKENKIVVVGSNTEVLSLKTAKTKTIDAQNKLVLPGFNDAHVHFMGIGNLFSSIDLRNAKSAQEVAAKLKYYTEFLPKNRWILGFGWNENNWESKASPSKEFIDAVTPDNPVLIYRFDNQTALANSLALKLAGIDKSKNASVVLDEKGEPTGILKDAAINFVKNVVPQTYTQNWAEVAETATNYAASLGVTSVQDVHSDTLIETYRELERLGKLKTRIYDCSHLPDWEKLARAKIRRADGDAMIRGGCLKYFSDGDYEELPKLQNWILAADRADLQVMIHAIGTKANDIVLTIYERVIRENGAKDRRFRVEHAYHFRPEDLKRFSRSKIIPSLQPHLFSGDEPYRAFLNSGANLAFGSDASMTDFNPLAGIHDAVNTEFSANNLRQNLSIEEAVRFYTIGAAYAEFQEKVKGTISAGKLADLVILSDDIFTINPMEIKNAKVLTTIVDGKIVFERK